MSCPTDDPEPVKVDKETNQPIIDEKTGRKVVEDGFARTLEKPNTLKWCNLMDVGFRNMAGCQLNAYWQKPDTCDEKFQVGCVGNCMEDPICSGHAVATE